MERPPLHPAYGKLCFAASLLGWLPVLFTQSIAHGGSMFDVLLLWTGLVLGGYGTVELFRVTSNPWVKLILAVWFVPYAVFVGFGLFYAAPYIPRLFAT
jgi:hypothetical protein